MRRLRAGLVTPPPGGLGSPSVPTKRDRLKWLDAVRTKGGESRPDRDRGISVRPRPEVRPRGQKTPQWSAERRASVVAEATRLARRVGRLRRPPGVRAPRAPRFPALRSLFGSRKKKAGVPAPLKNRGGGALACRAEAPAKAGCLKFESEKAGSSTIRRPKRPFGLVDRVFGFRLAYSAVRYQPRQNGVGRRGRIAHGLLARRQSSPRGISSSGRYIGARSLSSSPSSSTD